MTALTKEVDYTVEQGVAVLTIDNPPVNALSQGVRQGIKEGVERALSDDAVQALVLHCAGRTFIAGADITEFSSAPREPLFHPVLALMESASKPIVAAIHGTALGGGLETAMCCHYRVAVRGARFGLPEVNLGLLPGAGGTQRLPRLVGPQMAAEMVITGDPIGSAQALEVGLIDRIVEGDLRADALRFAAQMAATGALPKVRDLEEKLLPIRNDPEFFDVLRQSVARKTRGFLAPEYNIRCIEAAVNEPFEQGLATESRLFAELLLGPQSTAQQYFFFAERMAGKVAGLSKDTRERPINRVGVVGAGTMGGGIAMSMVNAGIPVTLVETRGEALEKGLSVIRRNYDNSARKGRLTTDAVEQRMALIAGSLAIDDLADCDLIIEAVFEDMDTKKSVFGELDSVAREGAILASNTSALDLNEIAAATRRPESVIGMHFFSPANVMKLLEVVRGDATADDVIQTCMSLAKRINKVAVLVGVCHGFVGNRILFARQQQAQQLAMEGATPAQIDKVLYDFGFPMGPFQMSDLAGLDIGWNRSTSTGSTVRERLCEQGRLGQKSGAGYYDYDENRNATPSPIAVALFEEFASRSGITRRDISDEEILDRCLLPMVNEGAKILAEGIAARPSDIDVVYVYGYGWPVYRGGPMHYASTLGLDVVVRKLRRFREATGDASFEPAPLLMERAEQGRTFS